MAGELDQVVSGEVIEAAWGNAVSDRIVNRYADATERDTKNPTPSVGDIAWLTNVQFLYVYTTAGWLIVNETLFVDRINDDSVAGVLTFSQRQHLRDGYEFGVNTYGSNPRIDPSGTTLQSSTGAGTLVKEKNLSSIHANRGEKLRNAGLHDPKACTMLNSWATYFTELASWKTPDGTVHLNGMIRNGTALGIGQLATSEHYPQTTQVMTIHESAVGTARRVDVATGTGLITISGGAVPTAGTYLQFNHTWKTPWA